MKEQATIGIYILPKCIATRTYKHTSNQITFILQKVKTFE